jgi:hypothetical protein
MLHLLRRHRRIIRQLLGIIIILGVLQLIGVFLPGWSRPAILIAVLMGWFLLLGTVAVFLGLQVLLNFRMERSLTPKKLNLRPLPLLSDFRIVNTLDTGGIFRKAQLHTHSNKSYDGRIAPEDLVKSYRADGYSFMVITDHDRVSDYSQLSSDDCLVLPGIEETVPFLIWPLLIGKHLIVINPPPRRSKSRSADKRFEQAGNEAILIPAHLNWRGGAGSGRWYPNDLMSLEKLRLIEIESPHSRDPLDLVLWHKLNIERGSSSPVWGVAVDDSHRGTNKGGWIMVRTPRIDWKSFKYALENGAFYATSGPDLMIEVNGKIISVKSPAAVWIRFINCQNQIVAAFRAEEARYEAYGDEGFIRVEAVNAQHRKAWSQPMWLVAQE